MRVVCPTCSATYEVQDTLLVPGRAVRCTRCGGQWAAVPSPHPAPPDFAAEAPDPRLAELPPEPPHAAPRPLTAMDRLAMHPATLQHPGARLRAAWVASLVVVLLFAWGMITWRAALMHAWPPSTRLYDAIGLAPANPPAH
jgi:predicted Zn finger-like uncharacterized protein